MPTPIINLRCAPELHHEFASLAKRHGKSMSEMLRELMLQALFIDATKNGQKNPRFDNVTSIR